MIEIRHPVGGIRLSSPSLHLGHFVGTFAASRAWGEHRTLLYVIKDTEPFRWEDPADKRGRIEQLARQAIAVAGDSVEVMPLLASRLHRHAWQIFNLIVDTIGWAEVVRVHWSKSAIRDGSYHERMRHFLFPVDEAVLMTFLSADYFYSNSDNDRIVRFIRDIQRRLNRKGFLSRDITLTELRHFPDMPWLPGVDHARMKSAHENCLAVLADEAEILRFCSSSYGLGSYFAAYPLELERFRVEGGDRFVPQNTFTPFALVRTFAGADDLVKLKERFAVDRRRRDLLALELAVLLGDIVSQWRATYESVPRERWHFDQLNEQSHRLGETLASAWVTDS